MLVDPLDAEGDEPAAATLVLLQHAPPAGDDVADADGLAPAYFAFGEGRLPPGCLGLLEADESIGFCDLLPQQQGVAQDHRWHGQRRFRSVVSGVVVEGDLGVPGDVPWSDRHHSLRAVLPRLYRVVVP